MRNATSTLARNSAFLLMGLALSLTTAQLAGAQTTYAIMTFNESQACGTLDLTTGHWDPINSEPNGRLAGLGQFGNNLYGATGNALYQVNPVNCGYILVGSNNQNVELAGFGSTNGTNPGLYGITGDGGLYLVHANDGSTMFIGPTSLTTFTSLSANCPALYLAATLPSGNSALYSVNTNTGATTDIGDTGVIDITGMVCAGNELFATIARSQLCTLSVSNGAASCQIVTQPSITGMAYPPVPPPTFTVLHTFTGGADGGQPWAGLILDAAGNLYGTAAAGGTGSCMYLGATGCGSIYQLKPHNSTYTFNPLYSFQGGANEDGEFPARVLTMGPNGTYYGTTTGGGEGTCSFLAVPGCGTVFNAGPEAQPPRQPLLRFLENVLYRFTGGSDGGNPFSTVTFDRAGNIYGTTISGGTHGLGTVFELSPAGGGTYTETVLYNFAGGNDGANPYDGVVFDTAGNLYGTTQFGGGATVCQSGCGTVFELSPSGGGWTETVLYRFQGASDGQYPSAGVAIDSAGNLYGNTDEPQMGQGGNGPNTIYELSPNGSNWTYTRLFAGAGGDGHGRVVLDSSGNLYDVLQTAGVFGYGQVFELAHGNLLFTDLYDFTDGADGAFPTGGVVLDSSGNLFGTSRNGGGSDCHGACGVVWEILPPN